MRELFILAGEIDSGKTATLMNWAKTSEEVYGILSPKMNGRRVFMNASTGERFEMEAEGHEDFFEVGRYRFRKASFKKAEEILSSAKDKRGWLVIDEIGPLELKGNGFYEKLTEILDWQSQSLHLLLVVRTSILKEAIDHFELQRFSPKVLSIHDPVFNSSR